MSATNTQESYGLRNLVFDDFLPAYLEYTRYKSNPNQVVGTDGQNHVYAYTPGPARTDDPNAGLFYNVRLTGNQWALLALAGALTAYLIAK